MRWPNLTFPKLTNMPQNIWSFGGGFPTSFQKKIKNYALVKNLNITGHPPPLPLNYCPRLQRCCRPFFTFMLIYKAFFHPVLISLMITFSSQRKAFLSPFKLKLDDLIDSKICSFPSFNNILLFFCIYSGFLVCYIHCFLYHCFSAFPAIFTVFVPFFFY